MTSRDILVILLWYHAQGLSCLLSRTFKVSLKANGTTHVRKKRRRKKTRGHAKAPPKLVQSNFCRLDNTPKSVCLNPEFQLSKYARNLEGHAMSPRVQTGPSSASHRFHPPPGLESREQMSRIFWDQTGGPEILIKEDGIVKFDGPM